MKVVVKFLPRNIKLHIPLCLVFWIFQAPAPLVDFHLPFFLEVLATVNAGKLPLWALLTALLDVNSAGLFVSALSAAVDTVPHRRVDQVMELGETFNINIQNIC